LATKPEKYQPKKSNMKAVFFLLFAVAHGSQTFLRNGGEPLEAVEGVKQVPVVGEKFDTNGGVPTAMQCVVSLTIQFMVVYTALAICRMAADGFGLKYDNLPMVTLQSGRKFACIFAHTLYC
jgi:hypothetical protein